MHSQDNRKREISGEVTKDKDIRFINVRDLPVPTGVEFDGGFGAGIIMIIAGAAATAAVIISRKKKEM